MRQNVYKILTVALCITLHQSLIAQHNATPFTAKSTPGASPVPVKIVTLTSSVSETRVFINWSVTGNQDVDQFEVEKTSDGKKFVLAALVFATEQGDVDHYAFFEKITKEKKSYRIRMIMKDGSVEYSPVITPGTNN